MLCISYRDYHGQRNARLYDNLQIVIKVGESKQGQERQGHRENRVLQERILHSGAKRRVAMHSDPIAQKAEPLEQRLPLNAPVSPHGQGYYLQQDQETEKRELDAIDDEIQDQVDSLQG